MVNRKLSVLTKIKDITFASYEIDQNGHDYIRIYVKNELGGRDVIKYSITKQVDDITDKDIHNLAMSIKNKDYLNGKGRPT